MNKIFITNQYKVLEVMYNNTLYIANKKYCPLDQSEIANKIGLSRVAVNKIFNELKNAGYISMITRGKWQLSKEANKIIKITQNL